jgi:hypothetical protein
LVVRGEGKPSLGQRLADGDPFSRGVSHTLPHEPTARDALYAAYIEHGKRLRDAGDTASARQWFQRAADFDDNRGEAYLFLHELDQQP